MLLKSNVPMFHRITAFLAVICTIKPLVEVYYSQGFDPFILVVAAFLWLQVLHHWEQRKQNEPIPTSSVERYLTATGYDTAPTFGKIAFWAIIVTASFAIYFYMR